MSGRKPKYATEEERKEAKKLYHINWYKQKMKISDDIKRKPGRKPKYENDEERKEAIILSIKKSQEKNKDSEEFKERQRLASKRYRDKKRETKEEKTIETKQILNKTIEENIRLNKEIEELTMKLKKV